MIDKSQHLIIKYLNTIGSQQEISTIRTVSYLLNFPNHIIDYDFIYIPWYNLSAWVKEKEKNLQNIHIEKQNNIYNNFKTFIAEKTSYNTIYNIQYIIHNFYTNYQQRLDIFESLSLYEFSSKGNKINNTHCNRFYQNHPQYDTYSLYEYKYLKYY